MCTYEPTEPEIINTISDKLYNDGKFYYMRLYGDEPKELRLYEYDLNTGISASLDADGLPCIYNNNVCYKKISGDTIQLFDVHTQDHIADITSDNKLYSAYESDNNEYFNTMILNNVVKKLYRLEGDELTEYTVPHDELTSSYQVYCHTPLGAYVCSGGYGGDFNTTWDYIPY